jgi:hypothetical protein
VVKIRGSILTLFFQPLNLPSLTLQLGLGILNLALLIRPLVLLPLELISHQRTRSKPQQTADAGSGTGMSCRAADDPA